MLAVFGFEEEAEMFLRLGGREGDGWRAREIGVGELVSVLDGPSCADVGSVALDPVPGMPEDGTVGLVEVGRERFVRAVLGGPGRGGPEGRIRRRAGLSCGSRHRRRSSRV